MLIMRASIAICTRNRAAALQKTLARLSEVNLAAGGAVELLVVDNGSTDETQEVLEAAKINIPKKSFLEPLPGVARARNRALHEFNGDTIVFIDDDVVVNEAWLPALLKPLRAGTHQAALGFVTFPEHVRRILPRELYYTFAFIDSSVFVDGDPQWIATANFAITRAALSGGITFDVDLGPGALGFGEDTLFGWQLMRRGIRIASAPDAVVEHWVDAERLTSKAIRKVAIRMGQSEAYLAYHWRDIALPSLLRLRWLKARAKVAWLSSIQPQTIWPSAMTLYSAQKSEAYARQLMCESRRARRYA